MTTICPSARTNARQFILLEAPLTSQVQSRERQELARLTKKIRQNLSEIRQFIEISGETDDTSYSPVPAQRSFTVKVRYQYQGHGEPLPYEIDEE